MIEYPSGTPSWVDVTSPDLDASARFYGELLGWQAQETGAGYRMFWMGDAVVAGLGAVQQGHPPAWTTYGWTNPSPSSVVSGERRSRGSRCRNSPATLMAFTKRPFA